MSATCYLVRVQPGLSAFGANRQANEPGALYSMITRCHKWPVLGGGCEPRIGQLQQHVITLYKVSGSFFKAVSIKHFFWACKKGSQVGQNQNFTSNLPSIKNAKYWKGAAGIPLRIFLGEGERENSLALAFPSIPRIRFRVNVSKLQRQKDLK